MQQRESGFVRSVVEDLERQMSNIPAGSRVAAQEHAVSGAAPQEPVADEPEPRPRPPRRPAPSSQPPSYPHVHPDRPGVLCPAPVKRGGKDDICNKPVLYGSNYCGNPTHQKHDPKYTEEEEAYESRKAQIDYYTNHLKKTSTTTLLLRRLQNSQVQLEPEVMQLLNSATSQRTGS